MTKEIDAISPHQVDIFIPVNIPNTGALRAVRDDREDHLFPSPFVTRNSPRIGKIRSMFLGERF